VADIGHLNLCATLTAEILTVVIRTRNMSREFR